MICIFGSLEFYLHTSLWSKSHYEYIPIKPTTVGQEDWGREGDGGEELLWFRFELPWIHLDSLGFTWTHSNALGLPWSYLDSLGVAGLHWTHSESYELPVIFLAGTETRWMTCLATMFREKQRPWPTFRLQTKIQTFLRRTAEVSTHHEHDWSFWFFRVLSTHLTKIQMTFWINTYVYIYMYIWGVLFVKVRWSSPKTLRTFQHLYVFFGTAGNLCLPLSPATQTKHVEFYIIKK